MPGRSSGPAATGLGLIFYGLLKDQPDLVSNGIRSLGSGLALFAAFGLFFEGIIGLSGEPFLLGSELLPIALIGARRRAPRLEPHPGTPAHLASRPKESIPNHLAASAWHEPAT